MRVTTKQARELSLRINTDGERDYFTNHAAVIFGRRIAPGAVPDTDALQDRVAAFAAKEDAPVAVVTPALLEEPNEFDDYIVGIVGAVVREAHRPVAIDPTIFDADHADLLERLWGALEGVAKGEAQWFVVPAGWCGTHVVAGELSDDCDDGDWEEHSIEGEEIVTVCSEDTTNIHVLTGGEIERIKGATATVYMECHYI